MKLRLKTSEERQEHWSQLGFKNLLLWLLVYVLVGPFMEALPLAKPIISVFLTLVLVSALGALGQRGALIRSAIAVLVVLLTSMWLETAGVIKLHLDPSTFILPVFLALPVYALMGHLFRATLVTGNTICAALCLYLLIGLLWGSLFAILESLVPNSFAGALLENTSKRETAHHLQYFSYVTLSTLGYGDITPQTRGASALCQAEAIIGQFLTIVVVARLVGIQVAQQSNNTKS
jgi:voltage-gated potassium channel